MEHDLALRLHWAHVYFSRTMAGLLLAEGACCVQADTQATSLLCYFLTPTSELQLLPLLGWGCVLFKLRLVLLRNSLSFFLLLGFHVFLILDGLVLSSARSAFAAELLLACLPCVFLPPFLWSRSHVQEIEHLISLHRCFELADIPRPHKAFSEFPNEDVIFSRRAATPGPVASQKCFASASLDFIQALNSIRNHKQRSPESLENFNSNEL